MGNKAYIGLSDSQVIENRRKFGPNVLTPTEETSNWQRLKDCRHFWLNKTLISLSAVSLPLVILINTSASHSLSGLWTGPLILLILLGVSWAVSFLGGSWDKDSRSFSLDPLITILLSALVLSGAISFYQAVFMQAGSIEPFFEPLGIALAVLLATGVSYALEAANEKTFRSLNEVNDETPVKTIRNGNVCQIPRKDIVVGDVIILEAGEEVPADCRLLEALDLSVNESSLTGEPICAKSVRPEDADPEATYPTDQIMRGCTVSEGYCTAEVFAVGDATACGKVFKAAQVSEGESTPLSRKLDELADIITKLSYGIAGLIVFGRILIFFLQNSVDFGSTDAVLMFVKYVLETLMIAVTLVVVAVPEGLPMAVTLSLAFSMKRLMKQNTLPRTMHSCETMGAVSVICTDKTGTLTENRMTVSEASFSAQDDVARECICVNTTANIDFSDQARLKAVGNPTEGALLIWLHSQGIDYRPIRDRADIIGRLPFSTELKYMATLVQTASGRRLYVKGAPEILLDLSATGTQERADYDEMLARCQQQAMRTLGFAYKELDADEPAFADGRLAADGLTMIGITAISDPVRKEVPAAIGECIEAGIEVKIVTGDTPGTAKEIARQIGLWRDGDGEECLLSGREMEAMSDEELSTRLKTVKVISRARPNDKERAVRLLRSSGQVVAVTGDGTNDAPALNAADVGLSMGDGTAVAKEASDMTILDNSFSTIANAVMWGRSLYKNIKRFILFQMTVNVAACLIVAIGAFVGTESPLTVTQMLWVNLIMDTFAALALASLPPTRAVMAEKPRPTDEHVLKGMGAGILGTGLSFSAVLLGFLLYLQHNDVTSLAHCHWSWGTYDGLTPYECGLFFTGFVLLQFWNLFNAKAFMTGTSAITGLSWKNTRWFIIIATVILGGQIVLVQFGGAMFNVAPGGLSLQDWLILVVATMPVMQIGEIRRALSKA